MKYKNITVFHIIWYVPWLPILVVLPVLKRDEIFPPVEKDFVRRIRFLSILITIASAVPAALGALLHFSSYRISLLTLWVLVIVFIYGVAGILLTFLVKHGGNQTDSSNGPGPDAHE
jgi:hypothetical protein